MIQTSDPDQKIDIIQTCDPDLKILEEWCVDFFYKVYRPSILTWCFLQFGAGNLYFLWIFFYRSLSQRFHTICRKPLFGRSSWSYFSLRVGQNAWKEGIYTQPNYAYKPGGFDSSLPQMGSKIPFSYIRFGDPSHVSPSDSWWRRGLF